MYSFRAIKTWGFQLILLAGLLTYSDSVAIATLPVAEMSSWVLNAPEEHKSTIADYSKIHRTAHQRPLNYTYFLFNTYLVSTNRKVHTSVRNQRNIVAVCKTIQRQCRAQLNLRLDLPEIEA